MHNSIISIGSAASIFSKFSFIDQRSNIYKSQKTPALCLNFEFLSKSKINLGLSLYYERFEFYESSNTGNVFFNRAGNLQASGNFSKKVNSFTRLNPGFRALYNFYKNNNNSYAGARIGYELFVQNSNNNKYFYSSKLSSKIALQTLIGYRVFVNNWGFNTEFAVGKPFWFFAGVNYKLNSL